MSRFNTPRNARRIMAFPHLSVSVTAESDALAVATVANWINVQSWLAEHAEMANAARDQSLWSSFNLFNLEFACDAAETLTAVSLYAIRLRPVTIADDTFTSSGSDNINTATAHGMLTGDGPFRLTTTGTLPAPLALLTDYYAEKLDANTFALHTSRADAIAGAAGVVTTDTGTGTHTIADVQSSANADNDTRRCHFMLWGDLNAAKTITVAAQTGYLERIYHDPLNLYYSILGTSGTGAQTLEITATPIVESEQ